MVNVAEAAQSVVDRLAAGGVRATLDERDLNPPCVFVSPPAIEYRFGRGDFTATFTGWAVTGAAGRRIDLGNLGELLDAAAIALDFAGVHADPADLVIPEQPVPLPAYRFTWSERVHQPTATPKGPTP